MRLVSKWLPGLLLLLSVSWLHNALGQSKSAAPAAKPAARSGATPAQIKPSLDALVRRANVYWNLLSQGKKLQAMAYVAPSCRDYFLERPFPRFAAPRITRLEPLETDKEVDVTVTVRRRLPTMPEEMNYPVVTRWLFSRGNWWVMVKEEPLPIFNIAGEGTGKTISAEEMEKRKSYMSSHLQFPRNMIDFGTVRKGGWAEFEIEYSWSGDKPVDARLQPSPLEVVGFSKAKLTPGSNQRIPLKFLTSDYDGEVRENLTLLVNYEGVGVLYGFKLQGRVYTPLSVIPPVLRFREGEKEMAIEVINNSKSEVSLESVISNTYEFKIQPLPQRLAPGARCSLKVMQSVKETARNYVQEIGIRLAAPVDEMANILITVVSNFEGPGQKSFGDLTAKDVDELLKKVPPNPIKP